MPNTFRSKGRRALKALCLAGLMAPVWAQSQAVEQAMLRVACDDASVGAEITINGQSKGACPVDIPVKAGTVRLRAVKKAGNVRESVFEQEFNLSGGTVKRIEVELGVPQLTAEGRQIEQAQALKQEAAKREAARVEDELLQTQRSAAEAGHVKAMLAMGQRFASGQGVTRNLGAAERWYRKAYAAGSMVAAYKLTYDYTQAQALPAGAEVVRMLSVLADAENVVNLEGEQAVRAFVEANDFFEVPGGPRAFSFTQQTTETSQATYNCTRKGRIFALDIDHAVKWVRGSGSEVTKYEQTAALGGLLPLTMQRKEWFGKDPSAISAIHALYGKPFPLANNKGFGITYTTRWSDRSLKTHLACAPSRNAKDGALTCIRLELRNNDLPLESTLFDATWDEPSGCFARRSR